MITFPNIVERVSDLLQEVAFLKVMPRFRSLARNDVEEKSSGDIVTIADREAEEMIATALIRLMPTSRVVGEEAAFQNPALLNDLDDGTLWLIDPIDGTANFAAGRSPFALMLALVSEGETLAGWIFDPVSGSLATAERGSGAWLAGTRITTQHGSPAASGLRGAVFTNFMSSAMAQTVNARLSAIGEALPGYMCCGAEYPSIAQGEEDFALFGNTQPWDHAPGALFLTEAGGRVARLDGSPYRPNSGHGELLAARCETVWIQIQDALTTWVSN
ncbi:inositol monophosphatase family protein [Sphingomonas sp. CJ20]